MRKYFTLLLVSFILLSCEKEEPVTTGFTLGIQALDNGSDVSMGEEITGFDGRKFSLQTFRFYLSDIRLVNTADTEVYLKDVFLYKWGADEALTLDIPAGSYDSLVFGLGLSPALNNSNPNTFDDSHPLSIAQDMFWPMLKYRFVLMEGAVDTSLAMTGAVNFPVSYHLGADELYRRIAIYKPFTISEGGSHSITLPVELKAIFDGPAGTIDMRTHFANHSTDLPKAAIMIDNLAAILHDI